MRPNWQLWQHNKSIPTRARKINRKQQSDDMFSSIIRKKKPQTWFDQWTISQV